MKEVKLASGAVLKISNIPFAEARGLYQALMVEAKAVKFTGKDEFGNVFKDLFCTGFSSPLVEQKLNEVFKRCQYCDKRGELKIDNDTFEPMEARADYVEVCIVVVKEVCGPFLNGLYVEFKTLFEKLGAALT